MKNLIFTIIFLLYSYSSALASNEVIKFDGQNLTISDKTIRYDNFDNILLPNGLSLPFQTIYLPLAEFNQTAQISVNFVEKEIVTTFTDISLKDIPTTSDKNRYKDIVPSVSFDRLGYNQIEIVEKVTISNTDYLKCMIFPVTIDSTGIAVFHNSSEFQIGSTYISENQLLTKSEVSGFENNKNQLFNRSLSQTTQYVIITNQNLKDSFAKLASYKNETGISTEIKLIEDILAEYTGRDDAEKLREYLKVFYADGGQFVLFGGDETVLPIRYTYHNIAYGAIPLENQQVSDLYFGDLTGDWNADNDSVWGEKYTDSVDLTPELFVGRLPFNKVSEVTDYISKLIQYETNQKQIDLSYLEKSFFFSSDQMRDYGSVGQHGLIADALPNYFIVDTTNGVEQSAGNDLNPTNASSKALESVISEGFGIVNIIAHGSSMTFEVRTSNYNEWPKSYFTTDTSLTGSGIVSNFEANDKVSLYISLGCDNGAFDLDQPPYNHPNPNMVQTLLAQKNSGAVGFVANTRWGWVSSSHLLQKRFLEYLFANENQPAVLSLYQMRDDYYYYRDLVYGINYFGDPTMIVYTKKPEQIELSIQLQQTGMSVNTTTGNTGLENTIILLSENSTVVGEYSTDNNGNAVIDYQFDITSNYKFSAVKDGYTISQKEFIPSIATDIEDENNLSLPTSFSLGQNYPNPFNPSTRITLSLPKRIELTLQIFNVLGQNVKTLADGSYSAGTHTFEWDGKDKFGNHSATGIYFYRIETSEYNEVKKMLLLQ